MEIKCACNRLRTFFVCQKVFLLIGGLAVSVFLYNFAASLYKKVVDLLYKRQKDSLYCCICKI